MIFVFNFSWNMLFVLFVRKLLWLNHILNVSCVINILLICDELRWFRLNLIKFNWWLCLFSQKWNKMYSEREQMNVRQYFFVQAANGAQPTLTCLAELFVMLLLYFLEEFFGRSYLLVQYLVVNLLKSMRTNMWQVCQPFPVIFTFKYIKCIDVPWCRDVYLLLVTFCLFSFIPMHYCECLFWILDKMIYETLT